MNLGERDVREEADKWIAWKKNAKGKGYRWSLQRNLVACLSLMPLTNTGAQAVMTLKHGMTSAAIYRMMSELRSAGVLEQFLEADKGYYWRTTDRGVSVYLGSRKAIPVLIVKELVYLANVNESEEKNQNES